MSTEASSSKLSPLERVTADGAPAPLSWRVAVTLAASIAGLGVSVYLTIAHYSTAVSLTCPVTATLNCEKVTTSPESHVFGIPVAVLGLAFFVPMLLLSTPAAWRSARRIVPIARLALAVSGIGFVFYLVHAEFFDIHAICLWCSSVHLLTLIIFVAVVTGWDEATAPWRAEQDAT